MNILHIYDENDHTSAHYVAMLTQAVGQQATMRAATSARQFEELCQQQQPDIVHLHALPPFSLPPGHRLVLTPHGQPVASFVEGYVIIARSPLEYERLKESFQRVELVRNPLITRTTTPEACAQQMLAIYQRVMDSCVLELMNQPTRTLLSAALAAAVGGDRRWAMDAEGVSTDDVNFRQLYIYTRQEGVHTLLQEGLRLLAVDAPPSQPVSSYLPTDYRQPQPMERGSLSPAAHFMQLLDDVRSSGPSLLRLAEMAQALHHADMDEEELLRLADERQLRPLLASAMQVLSEQLRLTPGFMPCPPADGRQTAQLRAQLAAHMQIGGA